MRGEARDHKDSGSGTRNPEPATRNSEPGTRNPQPGTRNLEPGTRNLEPALADLADALRAALERLQADVKRLAEAVEAENRSLVDLQDRVFSDAQGAKESALEAIAQAKAEVVGVVGALESALGCEPGSLTVASLESHAPKLDWTYAKALAESISATLEAVQDKSGANVEMVRVRLDYFDFLSNLILKTWESATGSSLGGGESVSVIVDKKA